MSSVPVLKQAILCHCGHAGDCCAETNPDQWNFRDGYNYVGLNHSAITKQYINELHDGVRIVLCWLHNHSPDVRCERVRWPWPGESDANSLLLDQLVQPGTQRGFIRFVRENRQPRNLLPIG